MNTVYFITVFVFIIILTKYLYKCNYKTRIERFGNKTKKIDTVLKKVVNTILAKEDISTIKNNIIVLTNRFLEPKKKYLLIPFLKLLNKEIVNLPESSKKNEIMNSRRGIVEYFAKKGHDVNCMIDLNFCSNTKLSGISGLLATKSKLLISSNKEYKLKLEKIADIIGEI
jgi:hypothetical protein